MDLLDEFLGDLKKRQEILHLERLQEKKTRVGEMKKLQEKLNTQRVETDKSREMINKNLTLIASYKHNIKNAEEKMSEHGLPLSNAYHGMFIDLVTGAINFTNTVGESINSAPETVASEITLVSSIKECNENLLQHICKDKNRIENVEMLKQNIHIANDVRRVIHPVLEEVDNCFESSITLE